MTNAAIWSLSQIGGEDARTYIEALLDQTEDDDDQIEFLEEALDNLSFTEDLDRFELMAIDPDADLEELEEIDELEEVEEDEAGEEETLDMLLLKACASLAELEEEEGEGGAAHGEGGTGRHDLPPEQDREGRRPEGRRPVAPRPHALGRVGPGGGRVALRLGRARTDLGGPGLVWLLPFGIEPTSRMYASTRSLWLWASRLRPTTFSASSIDRSVIVDFRSPSARLRSAFAPTGASRTSSPWWTMPWPTPPTASRWPKSWSPKSSWVERIALTLK